ncbi:glutaredoxin family protein [Nesterenkonia marinintestina]|uniref:glutaredoxin family protein n=1 Tax=Nesterenkonia marinintestina TaxID=2979865 RepID=UPI0021C1F214|nr:glutaredoxin family protein [Nesterenkonia sp. GX14115]
MMTVWGQPNCGPCSAVTGKLDRAGVVYEYKDLTEEQHAEKLAEFKEAGYQGTPLIETPDEIIQHHDPLRLKAAIERAQQAQMDTLTADPELHRSSPDIT